MSHLSTLNPLSLDPSRPTLFELISAEQLSALLSPSLRYVLAYFAARHPRYLLKLVLNYDELYAALACLIEYRCLRTWNASFTESFYDLKRRRVLKADRSVVAASGSLPAVQDKVDRLARLRSSDIKASLLFLVGGPYLQDKLERYYESLQARSLITIHTADNTHLSRTARLRGLFDQLLAATYPTLKLTTGTITLLLNLLYLFGKSPYHSLTDFLIGIRYARQSGPAFTPPPHSNSGSSSRRRRTGIEQLRGTAAKTFDLALSAILPTAVFALKFLEWWHASDFARQLSLSSRRQQRELQQQHEAELAMEKGEEVESVSTYALDPPLKPNPKSLEPRETDGCGICGKPITDPTAIETGRVFCYQCIYSYVINTPEKSQFVSCPSTGQRLLGCRFDDIAGHWVASGLRRLVL